jgi:hypothetical protein
MGDSNRLFLNCRPWISTKKENLMYKIVAVAAVAILAFMAAHAPSDAYSASDGAEEQYEVLSPWAEVDPIPVRGISPRIDTLAGKKIGLFANFKRAAVPISREVERRLKEKYPDIETDLYHSTAPNIDESVEQDAAKFEAWAKSMDAVVAAVGD